jgi:hypothetical protein
MSFFFFFAYRYKTRCSSGAIKWQNCLQHDRLFDSWLQEYDRNGRPEIPQNLSVSTPSGSGRRGRYRKGNERSKDMKKRRKNAEDDDESEEEEEMDYWENIPYDDDISPVGLQFQMQYQLGACHIQHVPYGEAVQQLQIGDQVIIKRSRYCLSENAPTKSFDSIFRRGKVIDKRSDGNIVRHLLVRTL